jgi:zinc protease
LPTRCTASTPYKTPDLLRSVATRTGDRQSLDVIRAELKPWPRRADASRAGNAEVPDGSFALRFDSNAKIANQLLWIQQEELGLDYVDRRNGEIEAVTMGDIKRAAKRLFEGQEPIVIIVGKPVGMAVPTAAASGKRS